MKIKKKRKSFAPPPLAAILALLLSSCVFGRGTDPDIIARPTAWYSRTDPQQFFERERARGAIYYIGFYDPKKKDDPVPGIDKRDPHFSPYITWLTPSHSIQDPDLNREFLAAVERFARRYNPLVLQHLKASAATRDHQPNPAAH